MSYKRRQSINYNIAMRYFIVFALILIACFYVHAQELGYTPIGEGLYDSLNPMIQITGSWTNVTNSNMVGGSYRQTTATTATMSFQTYASGFSFFFVAHATSGAVVEVCIDDVCGEDFGLTDPSAARFEVTWTGLPRTLKTVELQFVSAGTLNVDAISIHTEAPSEEVTATPDASVVYTEYELGEDTYVGVAEMRVTSGDVAIVVLLVVIALVGIFNLIVGLMRRQ